MVDARPGAGATLAATQVARAAADGYTLLGIPSGHAVSAAMYRKLAYQPVDDFTFISTVTEYPFVLVTYPDHAIKTFKDLVAAGRSRKEPLLYGGPNGTLQHLSVELSRASPRFRVQLVPYRGSPQAVTDLLGKRLDFMLDPPTAHLEAIRSGQLRAIAVTGATRFFALPDVPTVAESGFPDYVIGSWQGVVGPAGLPDAIATRLNKEIAAVIAEPAVAERLKALGNDPQPSNARRVQEPGRGRYRPVDQSGRGCEYRAHLSFWENCVTSVETSAPPVQPSGAATPRPVFVSSEACLKVLRWDEMVDRLRAAYSVPLSDKVSPPRTVARGERTWIRALVSSPPSGRYMGAKVFGMSRDKRVGYTIALMDQQSGGFAGLLDAYYVTSFRTGATSAVAVDKLATPGPKTVAVLGSGSEANSHTLALKEVRPISALRVFSPTRGRIAKPLRRACSASTASRASRSPRRRKRWPAPISSWPARARATRRRSFTASGSSPAPWWCRSARRCRSSARSTPASSTCAT